MATKVKSDRSTISKICSYHEEYYLCGKFHAFMKECTLQLILGTLPLYTSVVNGEIINNTPTKETKVVCIRIEGVKVTSKMIPEM